jgi:hypothetical protein
MVFVQENSNKSDTSPHERDNAKNSSAQGTPAIIECHDSLIHFTKYWLLLLPIC